MIGCDISPTDAVLVENVLEGPKRRLATSTNKKDPVTLEMLSNLYRKLFSEGNLYYQRIICACLTAYAGILLVLELLNIKRSDLVFDTFFMSIFIQKSKTDIYRDGNWVIIARLDSNLCPVKNMELYLLWADVPADSDFFIFRNLT